MIGLSHAPPNENICCSERSFSHWTPEISHVVWNGKIGRSGLAYDSESILSHMPYIFRVGDWNENCYMNLAYEIGTGDDSGFYGLHILFPCVWVYYCSVAVLYQLASLFSLTPSIA